jgi:hypothetical protein
MARSKVLWSVAAILFGTVVLAWADDEDSVKKDDDGLQVGATTDFFSKYIWRGQNVVDKWVFQPGMSVGYKGLTGSIWNSMNLEDQTVDDVFVKAGNLTETDLALDYSNKVPGVEFLGFSVGTIYYSYLNTHTHPTAEVYGGLGINIPSNPTIRWYYDFDQADGSYVQFSVGHTIEKKFSAWSKECSCGLQAGASLGMGTSHYNAYYFRNDLGVRVDQTALNDFTLTAGIPISLGKLTIKPSLGYSMMLNKDIRAATDKSDNFWGGVSLAYNW